MNEYGIFKKLEDGSYLVPEYSVNSICFDKEWFIHHPEEEYLILMSEFQKAKWELCFHPEQSLMGY